MVMVLITGLWSFGMWGGMNFTFNWIVDKHGFRYALYRFLI